MKKELLLKILIVTILILIMAISSIYFWNLKSNIRGSSDNLDNSPPDIKLEDLFNAWSLYRQEVYSGKTLVNKDDISDINLTFNNSGIVKICFINQETSCENFIYVVRKNIIEVQENETFFSGTFTASIDKNNLYLEKDNGNNEKVKYYFKLNTSKS